MNDKSRGIIVWKNRKKKNVYFDYGVNIYPIRVKKYCFSGKYEFSFEQTGRFPTLAIVRVHIMRMSRYTRGTIAHYNNYNP